MSLQDFLAEDPLNVTDDDIGEFLINVITRGLYIEPHIILREYIQNSHDAITAWGNTVEPGRIYGGPKSQVHLHLSCSAIATLVRRY